MKDNKARPIFRSVAAILAICGSKDVIGHGTYRGRNQYMCKNRRKTSNDLTGTPLSETHYPEKWMMRFNGVAIRHLNNYINWFRGWEKTKHATDG